MFVIQFVAKRHPFEADVTPSPEMPKYDSQHFSQLDGMPLSLSIQGADESRKLLLQNQLRSSWALEKAMVLWRSSLLARRTMNRFYEMRCAALLETAGKPRMKTWTSREYPRSHFPLCFKRFSLLFSHKKLGLLRPEVKTSHVPSVPILVAMQPSQQILMAPKETGPWSLWSGASRQGSKAEILMLYGCSVCIERYDNIYNYILYVYIYNYILYVYIYIHM